MGCFAGSYEHSDSWKFTIGHSRFDANSILIRTGKPLSGCTIVFGTFNKNNTASLYQKTLI
jgi:hypothetical protein